MFPFGLTYWSYWAYSSIYFHLQDSSVSQGTCNLPCDVLKKSESKQSKGAISPFTFALLLLPRVLCTQNKDMYGTKHGQSCFVLFFCLFWVISFLKTVMKIQ